MTATTSYGSWHRVTGSDRLTLRAEVEASIPDEADAVIDAVAAAYREAINASLPDGVTLAGDEFYGPWPVDDVDIVAAVESVDFWQIVQVKVGP